MVTAKLSSSQVYHSIHRSERLCALKIKKVIPQLTPDMCDSLNIIQSISWVGCSANSNFLGIQYIYTEQIRQGNLAQLGILHRNKKKCLLLLLSVLGLPLVPCYYNTLSFRQASPPSQKCHVQINNKFTRKLMRPTGPFTTAAN